MADGNNGAGGCHLQVRVERPQQVQDVLGRHSVVPVHHLHNRHGQHPQAKKLGVAPQGQSNRDAVQVPGHEVTGRKLCTAG